MLLRLTLLATCVLGVTATPALAATTVTFAGNAMPAPEIIITGDDSANQLTVSQSATGYTITSLNADTVTTDPGPPCTANVGNTQVTCTGTAASFSIDLRAGDDFLNTLNVTTPLAIAGGAGNDTLTGGGGADVLDGGDNNDDLDGGGGVDDYFGEGGDDTIHGLDGNAERIACGAGTDKVQNDFTDILAECETGLDVDKDGFSLGADCDDTNAAIHPGAVDIPEDGIDEDCSGTDALNLDRDKDGFPVPQDCDDANAKIHPGAIEIRGNKVDENCDGKAEGFALLRSLVSTGWQFGPSYTAVRALVVRNAPAGARITTTCKGGGCRFKGIKRVRVKRDLAPTSLLRFYRHTRLAPGARVTVNITAAGFTGRTYAYRIRIGDLPALTTTCRDPGSKKSRLC